MYYLQETRCAPYLFDWCLKWHFSSTWSTCSLTVSVWWYHRVIKDHFFISFASEFKLLMSSQPHFKRLIRFVDTLQLNFPWGFERVLWVEIRAKNTDKLLKHLLSLVSFLQKSDVLWVLFHLGGRVFLQTSRSTRNDLQLISWEDLTELHMLTLQSQ